MQTMNYREKRSNKTGISNEKYLHPLLDSWSAMLVAKHYPGKFNVPYVAGMNYSSNYTGVCTTSFSALETVVPGPSTQVAELGSKKYLVMGFCPQITAFKDSVFTSATKASGFFMTQTDDINESKAFSWDNLVGFGGQATMYPMAAMYGSQGTSISRNLFIWASQIQFNL